MQYFKASAIINPLQDTHRMLYQKIETEFNSSLDPNYDPVYQGEYDENLVYDFYFKYSLNIIKENRYLDKLYDRFIFLRDFQMFLLY